MSLGCSFSGGRKAMKARHGGRGASTQRQIDAPEGGAGIFTKREKVD